MKFSCDRCGQRYSSADEPEPGHSYRVLCLACGGTVLLKGGEFPALPTFAADPAAKGPASLEAGAEEPVLLALGPMAQREPPAASHQRLPRMGSASRREPRVRRWSRLVAAGGVALATAGAGVLLFTGGPSPEPRGEARPPRGTSNAMVVLAGKTPDPDSDPSATDRAGASPAPPPQDRQGAPAALASSGPGPGREAAPLPSTKQTASPLPAKPAYDSSAKPEPLPASNAATLPATVPQGPPVATAPTAAAAPPTSAKGPTSEDVAAAVAAKRPAFEACVEEALRNEPGLLGGGLRVAMVVTVNPIGIVTSPQIEEPLLQDTALGECLRNVVRKLLFPAFEGEPFQARIPLVLVR